MQMIDYRNKERNCEKKEEEGNPFDIWGHAYRDDVARKEEKFEIWKFDSLQYLTSGNFSIISKDLLQFLERTEN